MSDSKRGLEQKKIDGEKFQNPYFLQNKSQDLHNGLHPCCQLAHFTPLSSFNPSPMKDPAEVISHFGAHFSGSRMPQ